MAVPNRAKNMSVSELNVAINEYFETCKEEGRFPTEAGMLLKLGIGAAEYSALLEDQDCAVVSEPEPESGSVFYRVQVGAFSNKENAEGLRAELIARGYSAFVVTAD